MNKKVIRLTEQDLHRMVEICVSKILNEDNGGISEELDDLAWKSSVRVLQSNFSQDREKLLEECYRLSKEAVELVISNPKKYFPNGIKVTNTYPFDKAHKDAHDMIMNELGLDKDSELEYRKRYYKYSNTVVGCFWEVLDYLIEDLKEYILSHFKNQPK